MPGYHTVQQGEYLSKIAADYGFQSYRTLWDHPQNAELKDKRKTPNVLCPGDRLFIPDREEKIESCPSGQRHRFQARSEILMLKVRLRDVNNRPLANVPCELEVEGVSSQLVTDGGGVIQTDIPGTAQSARLTVSPPHVPVELVFPIAIGSLDPVEEESGQRARLNNLGYNAGGAGDPDPERFRSAVEEFQCDNGIRPISGDCDARTQAKLKEVHGS